ncbi:MAG TPA: sigma-70 family RNA polymerase sigma factor [Chitinophaga sp.]|uniref:RNA polymerase sigma factor n=1 Tax=Chitinophaga sp. TaxID=1869181 RepID=UPI002F950184
MQDDQTLLQELKNGQESALRLLHDRYGRFLFFTAFQILGSEDEAKDVVQDFFADFWHKKRYFDVRGNVKSYFFQAVRLLSIRLLDTKKNRAAIVRDVVNVNTSALYQTDPAESSQIRLEFAQAVRSLPPQQARVFDLAIMAGKKRKEISAELGINVNTVKTHLADALKTLRKKLSDLR